MESKIYKKGITLLMAHEILRKKALVFLLVGSCLLIILCLFKPIPCDWEDQFIETFNTIWLSLSIGYISAFVFYIITVLCPFVRRQRSILTIVTEKLRYVKDGMWDTSLHLWGKDISIINNPKELSEELTSLLKVDGLYNSDNRRFILERYNKHLEGVLDVFQKDEYLPKECLDLCSCILKEPAWGIIRCAVSDSNRILSADILNRLSESLIHIHKKVKALYDILQRNWEIER